MAKDTRKTMFCNVNIWMMTSTILTIMSETWKSEAGFLLLTICGLVVSHLRHFTNNLGLIGRNNTNKCAGSNCHLFYIIYTSPIVGMIDVLKVKN